MTMTTIPALDRTSSTFKADVDTFFASRMPTFVTEANALQIDVAAKQTLATEAAVTAQAAIDAGLANAAANATTATTQATTATTQAGIATTKAGEANSSAIAAAASVASIAGGPVASVNGMTGVVTVSGTDDITLAIIYGATL